MSGCKKSDHLKVLPVDPDDELVGPLRLGQHADVEQVFGMIFEVLELQPVLASLAGNGEVRRLR